MSNGKFKLAQLQLGRIYLMGPGYIQSIVGDTVLEPDEARINLGGQICLTGVAATVLEPNGGRMNPASQIYLT
jgi:hypothetical protein